VADVRRQLVPGLSAEANDLQPLREVQPQGWRLASSSTSPSRRVDTPSGRVHVPALADTQGRIADLYRTYGIPIHFFVGRDGTIRDVRIGRLTPADMEQLIQLIVNG